LWRPLVGFYLRRVALGSKFCTQVSTFIPIS
jgi:hypothetical protein